ncbi:MAG: FixH family protein [Tumebacillaceae bacterium]
MKSRRIGALGLAAFLALGVSGCARADATLVDPGVQVQMQTMPQAPVAHQDVELRLHVMEDGQAVENAKVTAFLEMEEMDHGENRLSLQEQSGGNYSGRTRLPMGGQWIAHVRVEQNGHTDTANLPFQVSE